MRSICHRLDETENGGPWCDSVYSRITGTTNNPRQFFLQPRSSEVTCGARSDHKHPGKTAQNSVWCWGTVQDSREQMALLLFLFFFYHRRHPPNSGLLTDPSISVQLLVVAVETELLWFQFAANSCSRAKQSIDPVCHFHTGVSGGWWCVDVAFAVSRNGMVEEV